MKAWKITSIENRAIKPWEMMRIEDSNKGLGKHMTHFYTAF